MTSSVRRLTLVALAVLLAAAVVPLAAQSAHSRASASETGVEAQVLSLTNAARTSHGLAPLRTSSTLTSIARSWSAHLAASRSLVHNGSLGSQVSGWSMIGENIAMAWSASQAQQLWMASSAHRANILQRRFNRVGVGVSRASDGSLWFVVDFEQTAGSTVAPVPKPTPTATHHSTPTHVVASSRSTAGHRSSRSAVRKPPPRKLAPRQPVHAAPAREGVVRARGLAERERMTQAYYVDAARESGARPVGDEAPYAGVVISGAATLAALALLAHASVQGRRTMRRRG